MKYELGKLIQGLSYNDYAAEEGLRASDLRLMKRSPAHYAASLRAEKKQTEAQRQGLLVHDLLQNGEKFLESLMEEPEFTGKTKDGRESNRSAEAKVKRDAWYADLKPGAIVANKDDIQMLLGISKSIGSHRLVKNLVKDGVRETSLWVEDPDTGLTLKCKPDLITAAGFLVDFKSTRNAHPDDFISDIFSSRGYFYALQLAHYGHCLKIAGVSPGESATIIAIEKEDPFGIMVYPLDVGNLGPAEQWRAELTRQFAECQAKNQWPGYPEVAYPVITPNWVNVPEEREGSAA